MIQDTHPNSFDPDRPGDRLLVADAEAANTRALRAANINSKKLTEGIQPGERVHVVLEDRTTAPFETVAEKFITAPNKTGTATATINGHTTTFNVVSAASQRTRQVDTADPDQTAEFSGGTAPADTPQTIDVSSAAGTQGIPDVQSSISNKAATFAQSDVNNFAKAMKNDGNAGLAGLLVVLGLVAAVLLGGS